MADPAKIMARIREHGANVVIDRGRLEIVNAMKLPEGAGPYIRQNAKAIAAFLDQEAEYEERAAIIEHDGGIPRTEAEQFARLLMTKCPKDVDPADWSYFVSHVPAAIEQGLPA